ncbi:MAG: hypothetical protein L0Y44_15890 [Phycisphaerales bacterium]|nr:hypothetical protein [Phycisphaerales bacterium]MCI0676072.1 hypothetical protein [Phycisphaerales bacterium]
MRAPQYLPHLIGLLIYAVVLEYIVRSRDWFLHYPYIDNLMHFGWGAVIALAIIVFWRNQTKFVLVAVLIWQILWEISEIIGDRVLKQPEYMHDHLFPDGLIDTALDLLGASAALWLTRRSRVERADTG